jgi:hypothetical protein
MIPTVPVLEVIVFPLRVVAFPLLFVGAEVYHSTVPF